MKFGVQTKAVLFLTLFCLFGLAPAASAANNVNIAAIESLQENVRLNIHELSRLRKTYYLYEDCQKPEIWPFSMDRLDIEDPRFQRGLVILDITMDYYQKIKRGETTFNANELKSAIRTYENIANKNKEILRNRMRGLKIKIDQLERETEQMQTQLTNQLEQLVNPQTAQASSHSGSPQSAWSGNWNLKSKHTSGRFKGVSRTSKLEISFSGNKAIIKFAGKKADLVDITPTTLIFTVTAGGNFVTTTLNRVRKGIKGTFAGHNLASSPKDKQTKAVAGTYISVPAP